jgi:hypothetical protein
MIGLLRNTMTEEEARAAFSTFLDIFDLTLSKVDAACWFLEDQQRFARSFGMIIMQRIVNPPQALGSYSEQPILPLYYLVDAICKRCGHIYCSVFSDRLPALIEKSIRRGDAALTLKLGKLIDNWSTENVFNETAIEMLKKVFGDAQAPTPPSGDPSVVLVEPAPPEFIHFVADSAPRYAGSVTTGDIGDDRRLSRTWMRGVVEWESTAPTAGFLIVDIDGIEPAPKPQTRVALVKVTAENERANCANCSGTFDKQVGPTGELCYIDCTWRMGVGYIHQSCLDADTPDDLTRRLFGSK